MQNIYKDLIVDIADPQCIFIEEFNKECKKYGAVVYNYEYNSYQFIRSFEDIDYKKELLPDFAKIEQGDALLKGMNITIHYEFDPDSEEDEENLDIWNNDLKDIDLAVLDYDEDGQYFVKNTIKMNTKQTKHTIWFLNKDSYNYILDTDLLLLTPIIKDLNIARTLISQYGVHPFAFQFDEKDAGYQIPDLPVYHTHDHEHEHDHDDED